MDSFHFHNPVKIHFGKGAVSHLGAELKGFGKNVLLAYGQNSIKKYGIYDAVAAELKKAKKRVFELSGIMPNPRTEKVYEGIEICRKNNIDLILAVGGGSAIDCAKAIAAGAKLKGDFWKTLFVNQKPITDALPIATVLTMAATGSEMDPGGVITNWKDNLKLAYLSDHLYPKFSILDPTYTYTMPKHQMIYGCVDIFSHIMEIYFSVDDNPNVSDDLAEALMKELIESINVALKNPTDYVARSNMMWISSMALNGIIGLGKRQDWMTHQMEHALSAFYDIPHGAGLAIVHPVYLKYIYKNSPAKFARFAQNVFGISAKGKTKDALARAGIDALRAYFRKIGAPVTLGEVGIGKERLAEIAAKTNIFKTSYSNLTLKDVEKIFNLCLKY